MSFADVEVADANVSEHIPSSIFDVFFLVSTRNRNQSKKKWSLT